MKSFGEQENRLSEAANGLEIDHGHRLYAGRIIQYISPHEVVWLLHKALHRLLPTCVNEDIRART